MSRTYKYLNIRMGKKLLLIFYLTMFSFCVYYMASLRRTTTNISGRKVDNLDRIYNVFDKNLQANNGGTFDQINEAKYEGDERMLIMTAEKPKQIDPIEMPSLTKHTYRILIWTGLYGGLNNTKWAGLGPGHKTFHNCEYSNCEIIDNKTQANSSDAILVHMPNIRRRVDLPSYHPPSQLWIMVMFEPPWRIFYRAKDFNGVFNISITYSNRSDIYSPIGYIEKAPTVKKTVKRPHSHTTKSKLVAWFVGHCPTPGRREDYVKELQRHIPVDVYGVCGNLTCSSRQPWINGVMTCYDMLDRDYKFYLSFENSMCDEYVTEKIWRILAIHVVPVVLGGVDYTRRLPPHSFIDIRDFKSPQKLAEYLLMLDYNDQLYNEYFAWKPYYDVYGWEYKCRLCKYMNKRDKAQVSVVDRVDTFWEGKTQCQTPKEYYKGMGVDFVKNIQ